jgi:hypothetical protein
MHLFSQTLIDSTTPNRVARIRVHARSEAEWRAWEDKVDAERRLRQQVSLRSCPRTKTATDTPHCLGTIAAPRARLARAAVQALHDTKRLEDVVDALRRQLAAAEAARTDVEAARAEAAGERANADRLALQVQQLQDELGRCALPCPAAKSLSRPPCRGRAIGDSECTVFGGKSNLLPAHGQQGVAW